ncbi:hypothetical protein SAMN05216272_10887 [Pseudomonas panipatensis]|uniref:HTH araC/xylS-type domain-containing protein n=1 Tax=Pseudomonas panipatensis TaxID=428992 RepID=A0A1G8JVH0_9PSED|nr:hypothetical protein SAMN05216272_10887 [Pseudomonas panipatensis]
MRAGSRLAGLAGRVRGKNGAPLDGRGILAGSISIACLPGLRGSLERRGWALHRQAGYAVLARRLGQVEPAETAAWVGFSERGSLARAFRRWTGQSLGEYRRTLQPLSDA